MRLFPRERRIVGREVCHARYGARTHQPRTFVRRLLVCLFQPGRDPEVVKELVEADRQI